jgi:hypothetical protein
VAAKRATSSGPLALRASSRGTMGPPGGPRPRCPRREPVAGGRHARPHVTVLDLGAGQRRHQYGAPPVCGILRSSRAATLPPTQATSSRTSPRSEFAPRPRPMIRGTGSRRGTAAPGLHPYSPGAGQHPHPQLIGSSSRPASPAAERGQGPPVQWGRSPRVIIRIDPGGGDVSLS